jgi:6-pyruvoyltetrahydropterin/6-carboxytetrahydropterin synthase
MQNYSIRIESADLIFSAAHFITFDNGSCEALHGHDYRVKAEIFGPIGANEYVVDFLLVKDALLKIVKELDHRVLLPGKHPAISISQEEDEIIATHAHRRWVFPHDNCIILPISNTTTERFAEYIGRRLAVALAANAKFPATQFALEVGENNGFSAICRFDLSKK